VWCFLSRTGPLKGPAVLSKKEEEEKRLAKLAPHRVCARKRMKVAHAGLAAHTQTNTHSAPQGRRVPTVCFAIAAPARFPWLTCWIRVVCWLHPFPAAEKTERRRIGGRFLTSECTWAGIDPGRVLSVCYLTVLAPSLWRVCVRLSLCAHTPRARWVSCVFCPFERGHTSNCKEGARREKISRAPIVCFDLT
jgi:hypothetical protein